MDIDKFVDALTLEEKASLCSGADFWHTKAVERLNIPAVMVSDGPHGLRKQDLTGDHLGINDSIKAVCFPTGCTVASSFDKELIRMMGETLGDECQAEEVSVLLGPAINIKRSPLCGRNFEYFSEDPFLSSSMAAEQVKGIQSRNVGTSVKHYLANNQEHRRMTSDSRVDERTLREIYLASFETVIKESRPWTVMCSYNKINGTYAAENSRYLTEILRDEWGFDGFVVSDWGAVNDRVEGIKAGLDLEMPSSNGINDNKIVEAVQNGSLDEKLLDRAVKNILTIIDRFIASQDPDAVFDRDKDHEKARLIAGESMVLLKNNGILPFDKKQKCAFIGEFAEKPRFQGGGSSHINSHKITSALQAAEEAGYDVSYNRGYDLKKDQVDEALIKEACDAAAKAEIAVIFAGLPDSYESEGYDREHMSLPESHNRLIEAVTAVQPNTVVVLHNGSPVEMPWISKVPGVLEAYLAGQAGGQAVVDILFGDVNPSGKLAETFPLKLQDNPSYLFYLGEKDVVEYREGIFVGYRYYDKKDMDVLFPFGHGLSYTSFSYGPLKTDKTSLKDTEILTVTVDITNTGKLFGKEVVQLYVTPSDRGEAIRPVRELKGFEKVSLEPGETKTVSFTLNKRSFAYFNTDINDWFVENGDYGIEVGASSRDIRCSKSVSLISTVVLPHNFNINSTMGDIMADPEGKKIIEPVLKAMEAVFGADNQPAEESSAAEAITKEMMDAMMRYFPLRALVGFAGGAVSQNEFQKLLEDLAQL